MGDARVDTVLAVARGETAAPDSIEQLVDLLHGFHSHLSLRWVGWGRFVFNPWVGWGTGSFQPIASRNGSVPPPVAAPHHFMNAEGPVSTVAYRRSPKLANNPYRSFPTCSNHRAAT